MNLRHFSILLAIAAPTLGAAQTLSIWDAAYRLEADAHSGQSNDSQLSFNNNVGPQQSFFDRVDAFASDLPSSAHSWATVGWNCTPTTLDVELTACWDSVDFGAGNSAHMLSQLYLGINLDTTNFISIASAFDLPNSWAEIDFWNGNSWILLVNRNHIQSYSNFWGPGDYRLRAERHYDPVGNSTGCVPWSFHMDAQAVPEPATIIVLGAGLAVLVRRRR